MVFVNGKRFVTHCLLLADNGLMLAALDSLCYIHIDPVPFLKHRLLAICLPGRHHKTDMGRYNGIKALQLRLL